MAVQRRFRKSPWADASQTGACEIDKLREAAALLLENNCVNSVRWIWLPFMHILILRSPNVVAAVRFPTRGRLFYVHYLRG